MLDLFKILKTVVKTAQKRNEENPAVPTADSSVFGNMKKRMEEMEKEETASTSTRSRSDIYKDMREKLESVRKENEADPNIDTADQSIFDDIFGEMDRQREHEESSNNSQYESQSGYGNQDRYEQPKSSYPEYQERDGVFDKEQGTYTPAPTPTPQPRRTSYSNQAVTNSNNGSLSMRLSPDMGSASGDMRIPHNSVVTILQKSDVRINLDGRVSNFVLVEYNGQQGWILDGYLQ